MPIVYMMKGLPASGKTTRAKELIAQDPGGTFRVNRDALRGMLYPGLEWSRDLENVVVAAEVAIVQRLLERYIHVVIDDTNLSEATRQLWEQVISDHGATLVEVDCTYLTVEQCIENDLNRSDKPPIGRDIIKKLAKENSLA